MYTGSSGIPSLYMMLMLQKSYELCAMASLARTIPDEMVLIQDELELFLQRTKMTFADRPDQLAVGMEVWCQNDCITYRNGIIQYIGYSKPQNSLNLIEVDLSHTRSQFQASVYKMSFKPDNVFQIFQSTVRTYDVSRHYGFLNYQHSKSLFFHASHVIWSLFHHNRIEAGQVVKHTVKYAWNPRVKMINIVADNVCPVSP